MIQINNDEVGELKNYKAYVMNGNDMFPTINEGDYLVVDLAQKVIRSGEIYIVEYKNSIIVGRLLLDREMVKLIFDGATQEFDELVKNVTIIGRIIEVKTLNK